MSKARIYVASLADYNAGRLHGVWIDDCTDADETQEQVNKMLAESKEEIAEEWAIHDYDGFPPSEIGEYSTFEEVALVASAVEEHGLELVEAFIEACSAAPDELEGLMDRYVGTFKDAEDYGRELLAQTSEVPEHFEYYIDYERYGNDILMDMCWHEVSFDKLYVFYNQ